MIETDSKKQREAEFIQKYTLTPQDFRKMILEKAERARVYSKAVRKREIAEKWLWTAKWLTGNEILCYTIKKHKWAACRMKFLLWNEKLQRIKEHRADVDWDVADCVF